MGKRHQQNPGADFTKKKRKVGKGKATPDNATKTSFVSRGIVVPAQLGNKDGSVPTTKRKLSFTVRLCLRNIVLSIEYQLPLCMIMLKFVRNQ